MAGFPSVEVGHVGSISKDRQAWHRMALAVLTPTGSPPWISPRTGRFSTSPSDRHSSGVGGPFGHQRALEPHGRTAGRLDLFALYPSVSGEGGPFEVLHGEPIAARSVADPGRGAHASPLSSTSRRTVRGTPCGCVDSTSAGPGVGAQRLVLMRRPVESVEMESQGSILAFWFGDEPDDATRRGRARAAVVVGGPRHGRRIRRHFEPLVEAAGAGELDAWRSSIRGRLALILLTDQFGATSIAARRQRSRSIPFARSLCLESLAEREIGRSGRSRGSSCTCPSSTRRLSPTRTARWSSSASSLRRSSRGSRRCSRTTSNTRSGTGRSSSDSAASTSQCDPRAPVHPGRDRVPRGARLVVLASHALPAAPGHAARREGEVGCGCGRAPGIAAPGTRAGTEQALACTCLPDKIGSA